MRLYEIYFKEVILKEFWNGLEEGLVLTEDGVGTLLTHSNQIIFDKFNIKPTDKNVYSIVGSARLYLFPELKEAFNLHGEIGDLDIVIPNKELWFRAGLEKEWNEGGIYRPNNDGSIEVFNAWEPSKAGGQYADVNVRPTNQIVQDSTFLNGYFFMSLNDIMDYKTLLNRDKEKEIVDLIRNYQRGGFTTKHSFLKKMVNIIGLGNTKKFLGSL